LGAFGAWGAFTLGMAGTGGILGIGGGAANFPAPAPAAGACPAAASSLAASFEREMICVYGLGPLGASTGTGVCSTGECMKAPVAPSPDKEPGL
jgi:hypothetical protein